MQIILQHTDGRQTSFQQSTSRLEREIVSKIVPRSLFTRGPLIIGNGNPFTVVHPDRIACMQVDTTLAAKVFYPPGISAAHQIADRAAYLVKLDERWEKWRKLRVGGTSKPYEALVEIDLAGGWEYYVHVVGKFTDQQAEAKLLETLLTMPVLCIRRQANGINYLNPAAIVEARIYHSNADPVRPLRLIPADPVEI